MLNPAHMILGFSSNSLSAGPKLLGVERGSNSPDLPAQLLVDATLHKSFGQQPFEALVFSDQRQINLTVYSAQVWPISS